MMREGRRLHGRNESEGRMSNSLSENSIKLIKDNPSDASLKRGRRSWSLLRSNNIHPFIPQVGGIDIFHEFCPRF
jgi:hypothetical protein